MIMPPAHSGCMLNGYYTTGVLSLLLVGDRKHLRNMHFKNVIRNHHKPLFGGGINGK